MIRYAMITDEVTGAVSVGIGTDAQYYQSIGMTEMDVEQSEVDLQWYLTEKCPHYSETQLLIQQYEKEINSYKQKLADSDYKAIKYAEGEISAEDYQPIKVERQSHRSRINELQDLIKEMENK